MFSSVQSLSHLLLFATPGTAARQASLSITTSRSLLKLMSIEWCHTTISSFVTPFSCLRSFPASGSFPKSQFFTSSGQIIGVSALASVLPMNIQDWFPLGLTGLISFRVQGTLKSLLQHHSWETSTLWRSAFLMVQLSHPSMTTGKTTSFDYTDLCHQSNVSAL